MNEVLTESKKHAIVVNNLFHSIQDFVGFKSLDEPSVLEPLFPTQYFIAHESIEGVGPAQLKTKVLGHTPVHPSGG